MELLHYNSKSNVSRHYFPAVRDSSSVINIVIIMKLVGHNYVVQRKEW